MTDETFCDAEVARRLANEGKLIEAGFVAYALASDLSISDPLTPQLRDAYMRGAQHVCRNLLTALHDDHQLTLGDLRQMDLIDEELKAFEAEIAKPVEESRRG